MAHQLSRAGCGMRHRFHSICPYFAMFPEAFVEDSLAASPHSGVVFDPFCGRGTTMFQALLQGRDAAGCDVSPVAVCISGAKCAPPSFDEAKMRINELRQSVCKPDDGEWQGGLGEFFQNCFHPETLQQVRYLRSVLDWRNRRDDRFIAALCLGRLARRIPSFAQLLQQPHAADDQHEARLFAPMVATERAQGAAAQCIRCSRIYACIPVQNPAAAKEGRRDPVRRTRGRREIHGIKRSGYRCNHLAALSRYDEL